MLRLKKGCFCLELDVATSIIAILGILGSISQLIRADQPQTSANWPTHGIPYFYHIIGSVTGLLINACLFGGVITKNKYLLLPWLVIQVIGLFVINLVLVYAAIMLKLPALIGLLFIIDIISGHFIACVTSFYKCLEENAPKCVGYDEFSKKNEAKHNLSVVQV